MIPGVWRERQVSGSNLSIFHSFLACLGSHFPHTAGPASSLLHPRSPAFCSSPHTPVTFSTFQQTLLVSLIELYSKARILFCISPPLLFSSYSHYASWHWVNILPVFPISVSGTITHSLCSGPNTRSHLGLCHCSLPPLGPLAKLVGSPLSTSQGLPLASLLLPLQSPTPPLPCGPRPSTRVSHLIYCSHSCSFTPYSSRAADELLQI